MADTGNFYAAARSKAGMSQEHLAKAAGVSVRTVIRAESGQALSHESRRALCAALDIAAPERPAPAPPPPAQEAADAWREAVEGLLRQGDSQDVRDVLAGMASGLAEAIPAPRLVARPDAAAVRRFFNEREGMPWLAPDRPGYYRRLRIQFGLACIGAALACAGIGGSLLDKPGIGPKVIGGVTLAFAGMLCLMQFAMTALIERRKQNETRLERTLYAIDGARLWEVMGKRARKADGIRMRWNSIALADVTGVDRLDTEHGSVLTVKAGEGSIVLGAIGARQANAIAGILGYGAPRPADGGVAAIPARA